MTIGRRYRGPVADPCEVADANAVNMVAPRAGAMFVGDADLAQ